MPAVFQFSHKVITSTSSSVEPLNHVVTVALQALAPNNTKKADPERTTPKFTSNPAFRQYLSYVVQSSVHLWDNFACWFFLLCSHKHDTFLCITCESRSSTIKTVHRLLPLMSQEEGHCVCVENSSRVQVGWRGTQAVLSHCPRGPPPRLAAVWAAAWSDASRRRASRTAGGAGGGGCAARRHAPGRRARRHPRASPPCAARLVALRATATSTCSCCAGHTCHHSCMDFPCGRACVYICV